MEGSSFDLAVGCRVSQLLNFPQSLTNKSFVIKVGGSMARMDGP